MFAKFLTIPLSILAFTIVAMLGATQSTAQSSQGAQAQGLKFRCDIHVEYGWAQNRGECMKEMKANQHTWCKETLALQAEHPDRGWAQLFDGMSACQGWIKESR